MENLKLGDFLKVFNFKVKFRVTEKFSGNDLGVKSITEKKKLKEVFERTIYMVFQDEDGTLNIVVY